MLEKSNRTGKRKLNIWLPTLFALTSVFSIMVGFKLRSSTAPAVAKAAAVPSITKRSNVGKLDELMRYIDSKYVDEIDQEKLTEKAIEAILKELDPHSNYIPAEDLKDVNDSLEGSFDGVGIQFYVLEDTILVVSPVVGGPSEKVGIMAGDKIIQIEDSTVAGVGILSSDVVKMLKGKRGSAVNVRILRGNNPEILPFTIVRDKIPDFSIDAGFMVDEETGFIKISRFSGTTFEEFMAKIEAMNEAGMKNLIIDLRQNPGGYLTAATKIVEQIFTERQLIVYTQGRTQRKNEYKSTGRNFYDIDDVMILIDEGSASASEIMAGAIQDWDRGTVIGRRSFGKGLVQEQYDLSDGSALRLTVARYYTPSGRCIQKEYKDGDRKNYQQDIIARMESGELENQDSMLLGDTTKYYTIKGRVVYGGGGVTPDVFVPIDPIINNRFYVKSLQYTTEFVYSYMNKHKNFLASYETIREFDRKFVLTDKIHEEFIDFITEKGVVYDKKEHLESANYIRLRLKALFARQSFKEEGLYTVLNKEDPIFQKAMDEIRK